jgi:hypothetical protein
VPDESHTNLTRQERDVLKQIAERDGITEDEAATQLVKAALERRVRRRTGKGPARVVQLGGKPGTPRRK